MEAETRAGNTTLEAEEAVEDAIVQLRADSDPVVLDANRRRL